MYPVLDLIGYYGPVILFGLSFYSLIERIPYLLAFSIGSILNTFLNTSLKTLFREPRPKGQIEFIDDNQLTGAQQFGFPSGHAQASFFSLAFLFFSNGPIAMIYCMTIITFLTLYQRWKYRRHSVRQLLFGSLIGGGFAWVLVYLTQYYLYKPMILLL
jgi:membrane-associated phospholipid phosphatase